MLFLTISLPRLRWILILLCAMGGLYEIFRRQEKHAGGPPKKESKIPSALGGGFADLRAAYQSILDGKTYAYGPQGIDIITRVNMMPWAVGLNGQDGKHIHMVRLPHTMRKKIS